MAVYFDTISKFKLANQMCSHKIIVEQSKRDSTLENSWPLFTRLRMGVVNKTYYLNLNHQIHTSHNVLEYT